jgi:hypothetical protein
MPQKPLNKYEIALYNSNVTVSTTFWDWRHRVLTVYLSIVTAIGSIVVALPERPSPGVCETSAGVRVWNQPHGLLVGTKSSPDRRHVN